MEKFRCKLCLRKFANGRALGGHMRSHMMNLHVPPKKEEQKQEQLQHQHQMINDDDHQQQPSEEFEKVVPPPSSSSSSSSSEDEENENNGDHDVEKDLPCYGLRENPKRSVRTVDPEFFSAVEAGSVVLQDRESETESSKNHNCRRSKRARKSRISDTHQCSAAVVDHYIKGKISGRINESSSCVEAEPVSSISDTTPEEDVAYCLMMLSRDKWVIEEEEEDDDYYDEEEEKKCVNDDLNEVDFAVVKVTKARSSRGKYRCETCNKVFRSYQALGGHRASHKKIKLNNGTVSTQEASEMVMKTGNGCSGNVVVVVEEKIHECPVCFRVFSSGQALGGHKRSHGTIAATASVSVAKPVSRMIDLNLPAPLDDEDDGEISQMEVSAVSD